jgi:excisionase family DNA binding protein
MNSSNHRGSERGENGLWSAADVADYLKVSRSWVYQRAEAGDLPCLRMGGLLRFDPEAVRAFARGESSKNTRVVPFRPPGGGRR